jgi:hypothetical protein
MLGLNMTTFVGNHLLQMGLELAADQPDIIRRVDLMPAGSQYWSVAVHKPSG